MKPSQITLTDDEIEGALRRADKHGLFALERRKAAPRKPKLADGAVLLAAAFLLVCGFWCIGRFGASKLASSLCLPSIEVCQ